jgi:hypothetical protein
VNWHARIDSIADDFATAARRTSARLEELDARAERVPQMIADEMAEQEAAQVESPQERQAREAREERDRLIREFEARKRAQAAEQQHSAKHRRNDVVLPSDWTDIDEARLDGSGPPDSWLR